MKAIQKVNLSYKAVVDLFLFAHSAEASSILGIVLGNLGLNLNNFCTEFNLYTKDLSDYFLLRVRIIVFENRNFSFSCTLASLGYFLKLLSMDRELKVINKRHTNKGVLNIVSLQDAMVIFRLKFPNLSLKNNFSMLTSVINSCNLKLLV
jgi:ribosomal protein L11